jgi:hypothetical protein
MLPQKWLLFQSPRISIKFGSLFMQIKIQPVFIRKRPFSPISASVSTHSYASVHGLDFLGFGENLVRFPFENCAVPIRKRRMDTN